MHLNNGKLEIKCTENRPNLIVPDGRFLPQFVRMELLIANHIVIENIQKHEFKGGTEEIQVSV
jgi:hypothetical protein